MSHIKLLRATCWALLLSFSATIAVHAHGTMIYPQSRSWLCFLEGPEAPTSPACQAAIRESGTQPFYDWDSVNQLPDGDHQAFVKDGELCNASKSSYAGINLPREDWTKTPLIPDENGRTTMVYNASAPHSTSYWWFYVTKDGWNPLETLKWSDLEEEPFCDIGNVPLVGEENYIFDCPVPTDKEGYHIIYLVWQRSDSAEAFYSCSDVLLGTAAVQPTPTATPPPVAGECRSAVYSNIVTYREGDLATFEGQEWEAQWWVKNGKPGNDPAWNLVAEECAGVVVEPPLPATLTPTATSGAEDVATATPETPEPEATNTSVPATSVPTDTSTLTPTPEPTATEDPSPTPTPTPTIPLEPAGDPLNVGYAAGSNPSSNQDDIWLLMLVVGLSLLGTIGIISARKQ